MIIHGDCIEVMAGMPENSVDAVVTDPPYGLEFMGVEWDALKSKGHWDGNRGWQGDIKDAYGRFQGTAPAQYMAGIEAQLWHTQWATQALRVLKPGGYLLAFGGTRTYHRLVCGLEDAGFEIRDTICWLYGSGFPKNLDISKQIDKMAGVEREVARIRTDGNKGGGVNTYDDDSYIWDKPFTETAPATEAAKEWAGWGTALKPAHEPICVARKPLSEKNVALNVLKWGTGGIDIDGSRIGIDSEDDIYAKNPHTDGTIGAKGIYGAGKATRYNVPQGRWPANVILDEEAAAMLDEQSGESKSSGGRTRKIGTGGFGKLAGFENVNIPGDPGFGDSGGASRFYYCAKASSKERGKGNNHPTCKPIKLMEYLIKLVSREGATILDPFAGSGSTVLAAVALGRKCIAIEQSEEYCETMKGRCRQMVLT